MDIEYYKYSYIAKLIYLKYKNFTVLEVDDFIQQSIIIIYKLNNKYDPNKGLSLDLYLKIFIRRRLIDWVRKELKLNHVKKENNILLFSLEDNKIKIYDNTDIEIDFSIIMKYLNKFERYGEITESIRGYSDNELSLKYKKKTSVIQAHRTWTLRKLKSHFN